MAVRRILQLGDPTLRTISTPVSELSEAREVLDDLADTLAEFRRTHGFGRGISAIQIGVAMRVIFLEFEGRVYELVNPEFVGRSAEKFEMWDDCFSFPHLMVRLERHLAVTIRYRQADGSWCELESSGPLSELIQHEMDHLEGVLAVDYARSGADLATRDEYFRQMAL